MVGDPGIASVGRVPRVTGERHVSWRQELALGAVEYHIIYENNPVGKKLVGLRGNSFHLHRMEKIKKKEDRQF